MKMLGIIGGAGPMASCQLYKLIIEECQKNYKCKTDQDFPNMTILNYPFANMLTSGATIKNHLFLEKQLKSCIDQLINQKMDIITIACNTLHVFLPKITIPSSSKIIHITQEVSKFAEETNLKKILILATPTTIKYNLYKNSNIKFLHPNEKEQIIINKIISNILAGKITIKDRNLLKNIIKNYDIDGIILGCTELTLLNEKYSINIDSSFKILDSLKILAKAIVKEYFN